MCPDATPPRPATLVACELVRGGGGRGGGRSGGGMSGGRAGWTSRGTTGGGGSEAAAPRQYENRDRDDRDRDRHSGGGSDARADRSSWLSKPQAAAPAAGAPAADQASGASSWRTARRAPANDGGGGGDNNGGHNGGGHGGHNNNNGPRDNNGPRGGRENFSSHRPGTREHKTVSIEERNRKMFAKHLKQAEHKWVPGSKQDESELDEVEVVLRKVKSVLNKLTLDNYERLYPRLLEIQMTSHAMLTAVVNTVFDEALNEPLFGPIFAQLCVHLSNNSKQWSFINAAQNDDGTWGYRDLGMPEAEAKGQYESEEDAMEAGSKAADFKRILLNKCQKEFETKNQCVGCGV